MTVSLIRSAESHTGATGSVSQASYQFALGQTGDTPAGVLVFTMQGASATEKVTAVTYGGQSLSAVSGGSAADTSTEPGRVTAWFLGSGLPTGAQNVVVTRTNDTTPCYAVGFLLAAASSHDTEVYGTPVRQQENAAMTAATINPGADTSIVLAGGYSGDNTPAPAGSTGTTTAQTMEGSYAYSFGAGYETTPTTGSRSRGLAATSDDRAQVILAVREKPNTYAIAGTVACTSGTSGAVTKKAWEAVAGTVAATSGTSGAAFAKKVVAGTVAGVSGTSCAVTWKSGTTTYPIAGTCDAVSGTIGAAIAKKVVAGTAGAVSGTSGAAYAKKVVSGTVAATSGTSGAITRKAWLAIAGTVAAVSGTSGAVAKKAWLAIAGTVAAVSATSAAVTKKVWEAVAGTTAATSGTSGAVTAKKAVSGNAAAAVSGTSCAVTVTVPGANTYPIAGTTDCTSGTSGAAASRILKVVGDPAAVVSSTSGAAAATKLVGFARTDCTSGTSCAVSRVGVTYPVAGTADCVSATSCAATVRAAPPPMRLAPKRTEWPHGSPSYPRGSRSWPASHSPWTTLRRGTRWPKS